MRREAQGPALGAWGACWGAAIVFSLASSPRWFFRLLESGAAPDLVASVVLAVLALAVVLRPGPPWRLGLLAVAVLVHVAILLPETPNHRLILALGAIGIVLAITFFGRGLAFDAFVPAARTLAVVVYVFAFFAKLNRDFVDPTASCAVQFYGHLERWWALVPSGVWVDRVAIFATLLVEVLLPFALSWRPTRRLGVVFGLLFHLVLGLDTTQNLLNFSSVMIALLLLFLPEGFFIRLAETLDRERSLRRWLAAGLLAVVVSGLLAATDWPRFALVYYWVRQVVWTTCAIAIGATAAFWTERRPRDPWRARPLAPALVLGMLAVANGLAPYLGVKTRTAFDMYSNLRLEADRSNHWIVPRSLDLLGILRDRLKLLATDDPTLQRLYVATGDELTAFELAAHLVEHPATVEYQRGSEILRVDPSRPATFPEPPPWWLRKVLVFRPLGESSRALCVW